MILVVDRRGTFLRVSPSSLAILGYRPDEMVGRNAAGFLHPDDVESTRNEMRLARRGGEMRNFDCGYIHKLGQVVALNWTGVWSEPERQHFFIGRDVTDQKQAEQRLRQSERRFQDIAEISGDWLWETDRDHRYTLMEGGHTGVSPIRTEALIGLTRWEAVGADPIADEFWGSPQGRPRRASPVPPAPL